MVQKLPKAEEDFLMPKDNTIHSRNSPHEDRKTECLNLFSSFLSLYGIDSRRKPFPTNCLLDKKVKANGRSGTDTFVTTELNVLD